MNDTVCPRCHSENPGIARFCAHCGLALDAKGTGVLAAGQVRHPSPEAEPADFEPVRDAENLFFRARPAWGDSALLGTEPFEIHLFNGGYDLMEIVCEAIGLGRNGQTVYRAEHECDHLPRGASKILEVPSYDVNEPIKRFTVRLVSASFDWSPNTHDA